MDKCMWISVDRFAELIVMEQKFHEVIEAVYSASSLSYDKSRLSIDTSSIENLLRVTDADRYWEVYEILKEKENETNQD